MVWTVVAISCGLGVDALGWLLQVSSGKGFDLLFSGVDWHAVHDFCNIGLKFRFWFVKGYLHYKTTFCQKVALDV